MDADTVDFELLQRKLLYAKHTFVSMIAQMKCLETFQEAFSTKMRKAVSVR
jgi:hypothetical protein